MKEENYDLERISFIEFTKQNGENGYGIYTANGHLLSQEDLLDMIGKCRSKQKLERLSKMVDRLTKFEKTRWRK